MVLRFFYFHPHVHSLYHGNLIFIAILLTFSPFASLGCMLWDLVRFTAWREAKRRERWNGSGDDEGIPSPIPYCALGFIPLAVLSHVHSLPLFVRECP